MERQCKVGVGGWVGRWGVWGAKSNHSCDKSRLLLQVRNKEEWNDTHALNYTTCPLIALNMVVSCSSVEFPLQIKEVLHGRGGGLWVLQYWHDSGTSTLQELDVGGCYEKLVAPMVLLSHNTW